MLSSIFFQTNYSWLAVVLSLALLVGVTFALFQTLLYYLSRRNFLLSWPQKTTRSSLERKPLLKKLAKNFQANRDLFWSLLWPKNLLNSLLTKAGQPQELAVKDIYALQRLLLILVIPTVVLIWWLFSQTTFWLMFLLIVFILGYWPIFVLKLLAKKRRRDFQYSFNYFIDTVYLLVNAGMNFEKALFLSAKKFPGVLQEEFLITEQEFIYGSPLDLALDNLGQRMDLPEVKKFITAIKQSAKLGIPLERVLALQAEIIMTNRLQRAEELSRTAAIKISFPLVFFIFPALLILYLAPAILQFLQ